MHRLAAPGTHTGRGGWEHRTVRMTINEDTTFLVSDELGDVPAGAELGLYQDDTRFLSRYELRLDGHLPLHLAARAIDHYAASHILTNPALTRAPRGELSIIRQRFVGHGMHEDLDLVNHGDRGAQFILDLRVDADFAHIFDVKQAIDVPDEAIHREGELTREQSAAGDRIHVRYRRGDLRRHLVVCFSAPSTIVDGQYRFDVSLAPREHWHLCIDFLTSGTTDDRPTYDCTRPQTAALADHREHWRTESVLRAPRLDTDSPLLQRAYTQSVEDYAALQIKAADISDGEFVLAAGIPWFMALFGRDSLIAAYQALPFYPLLAKGVLRALARLQGSRVDRLRAEEPGKILHEHRYGGHTERGNLIPAFPYYVTVDATPLFLIVLAAVYRLTGDLDFARALRDNAIQALEWMDQYGDRDGDGYLEYVREADVGLDNQGWKDSIDSVRFHDGVIARPPIALCEVQGYAYAARLGIADVFDALGEPERAAELRRAAATLKQRFNLDFWLPERGFYAEALDGGKRPVDALTSNVGQLLWTGIADQDKAQIVAERLLTPELFSGWGIRTMATSDAGYNPISYHNGSIWPHDNSLIVAGLARYGFMDAASQVVEGLLTALDQYPDHRLPELFAGYDRREIPFVVEYPTASRPQAWASGSIFLLLSVMLGVDADFSASPHRAQPFLPPGIERLRVDGIYLDGRPTTIDMRGSGTRLVRRIHDRSADDRRTGRGDRETLRKSS